jgi:hypothetical protein
MTTEYRAMKMARLNPIEISENAWSVEGDTSTYLVTFRESSYACTCRHFVCHASYCTHIESVCYGVNASEKENMTTMSPNGQASASAVKPKNLISKMAAITAEMDRIKKRGKNQFHGYEFATESDIADEVRKLCGEHNIYLHCSMVPGSVLYEFWKDAKQKDKVRTTFEGVVTIYDGDSTEKLEAHWPAFSHDSDDKGVNKASTAFAKYAMIRTFHISTGDDPDSHADGGRDGAKQTAAPRQSSESDERSVIVRNIYKILSLDPKGSPDVHVAAIGTVAEALTIKPTPDKWSGFQLEQLKHFVAGNGK